MTAITQDEQRRMKVHVVRGGGGLRLHVREWGRTDGPPILFIHGWSQNHLCWERQYESALADEFRRLSDMAITAQEHVDLRLTDLSVQVDSLREQLAQMQHILKEVE